MIKKLLQYVSSHLEREYSNTYFHKWRASLDFLENKKLCDSRYYDDGGMDGFELCQTFER